MQISLFIFGFPWRFNDGLGASAFFITYAGVLPETKQSNEMCDIQRWKCGIKIVIGP